VHGRVSVFNKSSPKKLSLNNWTRLIVSVDLYNRLLLVACNGDIVFNSKCDGSVELQQSLNRDSFWSLQSLSLFLDCEMICEIAYLNIANRALPEDDIRRLSIYQASAEEFGHRLIHNRLDHTSTEIARSKFKQMIEHTDEANINMNKQSRKLNHHTKLRNNFNSDAVSDHEKTGMAPDELNNVSIIDNGGCKTSSVHEQRLLLSPIIRREVSSEQDLKRDPLNLQTTNSPLKVTIDEFSAIEADVKQLNKRNRAFELSVLSDWLLFNRKALEKHKTSEDFVGDARILSSLTGFSYKGCLRQLDKRNCKLIWRGANKMMNKSTNTTSPVKFDECSKFHRELTAIVDHLMADNLGQQTKNSIPRDIWNSAVPQKLYKTFSESSWANETVSTSCPVLLQSEDATTLRFYPKQNKSAAIAIPGDAKISRQTWEELLEMTEKRLTGILSRCVVVKFIEQIGFEAVLTDPKLQIVPLLQTLYKRETPEKLIIIQERLVTSIQHEVQGFEINNCDPEDYPNM